jgi:transposase
MMDTYTQGITRKRRLWSLEEKRRIIEETLAEGASVALVARAHGANANLVFNWRKFYQAGQLGGAKLLPVKVNRDRSPSLPAGLREPHTSRTSWTGTVHIELRHAQVRIEGGADPVLLRVLLECLQR